MTDNGTGGALAAALAKAQMQFATVKRDKKVTVKLKTGGSYEFAYAPLDSILDAVRKPLSKNGLVVVQLLDEGDLVTMLLHESGERLSGSVALPQTGDIQGLGSAITYLRRYAIQALLGIAAEEDDDGNRAAGNTAEPAGAPITAGETVTPLGTKRVTGEVVKGGDNHQGKWRIGVDGPAIGFKLKLDGDDRDIPQVNVLGDIGRGLSLLLGEDPVIGLRVTIKGTLTSVRPAKGGSYYRLVAEHAEHDFIEGPFGRVPASPELLEAASEPLFTEDEAAEIAARELAEAS